MQPASVYNAALKVTFKVKFIGDPMKSQTSMIGSTIAAAGIPSQALLQMRASPLKGGLTILAATSYNLRDLLCCHAAANMTCAAAAAAAAAAAVQQVPVELQEQQVRARLSALPIVESVVQNRVVSLQGRLLQQDTAGGDDMSVSVDPQPGELKQNRNKNSSSRSRGWANAGDRVQQQQRAAAAAAGGGGGGGEKRTGAISRTASAHLWIPALIHRAHKLYGTCSCSAQQHTCLSSTACSTN
jgi:hypothetical protein